MANRRNSIKKIRADKRKRLRNRAVLSELRTQTRKFFALVSEKKTGEAAAFSRELYSRIDKAAKKGVLPSNTAARRKSRAARLLLKSASA